MNNQTKRLRVLMKELRVNMDYEHVFARELWGYLMTNYQMIKDSFEFEGLDDLFSDLISAIIYKYSYTFDDLEKRCYTILSTLNSPYDVSLMVNKDMVRQLMDCELEVTDMYLLGLHNAINHALLSLSREIIKKET